MQNSRVIEALKRISERPDIHSVPIPMRKGGGGLAYTDKHIARVRDLKENIFEISDREISTILGISRPSVAKFIGEIESAVEWSEEANATSTTGELTALYATHPDEFYEDAPEAADEYSGVVRFYAPDFQDKYCQADQSDTIKRPITLPTFPFLPLPERYAA